MTIKILGMAFALLTSPALAGPGPAVSPGVDGSGFIEASDVPQLLFNGVIPPHGFLFCTGYGDPIFVTDAFNGKNFLNAFRVQTTTSGANPGGSVYDCFVTPPGYKPIGQVWIQGAQGASFQTRMW